MIVVVDASVLVEVIASDSPTARLCRVLLEDVDRMVVPHHAELEVIQGLRAMVKRGELSVDEFHADVQALCAAELDRRPTFSYLERIAALQANVTSYDAAYVALAEALDIPLVTLDSRLARAPGPRCSFVLVD